MHHFMAICGMRIRLTIVLIGTGKSLLLRAIISALRKKYSKNISVVSVTASTGMAASNIGGKTYIATVKAYNDIDSS